MIEAVKIAKKVDDTIKNVANSGSSKKDDKKGKGEKKKTGRPTCKRDEEEERLKARMDRLKNPNTKFIGMQLEKLENMHVILTAEDGMSK